MPWGIPLEAALQRLALLALSLVVGMLVWLAFTRKAWGWLGAALAWQVATYVLVSSLGATPSDLVVVGIFTALLILNGAILYYLYRKLNPVEDKAVPTV
jgi:hypothetical protein